MNILFPLVAGAMYSVASTKTIPTFNGITPALKFNIAFACYDARFHGVANPDDYICYEFQLPEKFGVCRFYQYEIKGIYPVS